MYTLIIEDRHGKTAAEISFETGSYTIGRVEGNDVVLPSNSVSRTHARIFVSNNKCYIDDLGSTAGSIINGLPITSRTEITNGTQIKIGEYMLYLEYKDTAAASAQGQEILKTQIVSGAQSGFKLVRVGDKFAGEEFMLTEMNNSIGRTEDNYILLSDASVSRSHATIVNQAMTYKLVDNNSANGTFVNGSRVKGSTNLQNGDEIRFGNLRFVFVPATQRVDLAAYNKRPADNKIILAIVGLVIVIIVCIIIIIMAGGNKDKAVNTDTDTVVSEDEAFAKLNVELAEASRNFQSGNLDAADDIIKRIAVGKNDTRITELQNKIDEEKRNNAIIAEGDKLFDDKQYKEAYDKYSEVSESSMVYSKSKDRRHDAELRMILQELSSARTECESNVASECLETMCTAAGKLKDSGKFDSSVSSAKDYLSQIAKNKKFAEFAPQVKQCLQKL